MRRLGIAVLGALVYTMVSAVSALAQSDIPPGVGGDVVVPPGADQGVAGTAFTGTDVAVWMVVAGGLLVLGVIFLLGARRRARAGT